MDLTAAFDTLDHCTLLHRFENVFGITGDALKWISSYLSNRHETVVIDGVLSAPCAVKFGVPQGSVLGPKYYTLYSQPLGDIIKHFGLSYHFYADDTQLYVSFKPKDNLDQLHAIDRLEKCLNDIESWMGANMLKLNSDKTEVLLFASKQNQEHLNDIVIRVGDVEVKPVSHVKNLGVIFDSALDMERHVQNISRSCFAHLRGISHIRRYLNDDACKSLINGLVTSRLDYCNALLCGLPHITLDKLQKVQNTAARIITRTTRGSHITPVLKTLHWLPVQSRIKYKVLILTYKAIHGASPSYFKNMLNVYKPARALRSQDSLLLVAPKVKYVSYGDRQFKVCASKLWNELPVDIRGASSIYAFKRLLKTYLFSNHYCAEF